jgi:GNAT superfamily N-acetyltransferase
MLFMGQGADAREGVASFLEKRSPEFRMSVSKELPDVFPLVAAAAVRIGTFDIVSVLAPQVEDRRAQRLNLNSCRSSSGTPSLRRAQGREGRMSIDIFTLAARPDLRAAIFAKPFRPPFWPEFMLHDAAAHLYFGDPFFERYVDFAFAAVEEGAVIARAFSVPFAFAIPGRTELPDGGWDDVIRWAHDDAALGHKPTTASALEISLLPAVRGRGIAEQMLAAMKANAGRHGFADLYAPVRPTQKQRQAALPMSDYARQTRPDGLPADPWLRTHVKAGGEIVKVAPYAMTIVGTLAEWSRWTGMSFTKSELVEIEGGLVPVHVSCEQDYGIYVEPGVWVRHRIASSPAGRSAAKR